MKIENLRSTKIKVETPEQSKRFQEFAFGLGVRWSTQGKVVSYVNSKFLYIDNFLLLTQDSDDKDYFNAYEYKELKYSELFPLSKDEMVGGEVYYYNYKERDFISIYVNSPGERLWFKESIKFEGKKFINFSSKSTLLFKEAVNLRLATPEEKQHLFNCIEAGKYVEPNNDEWWKDLKKGDYVVCTKKESEFGVSVGYERNTIFKIKRISTYDNYCIFFPEPGGDGWYHDTIRKATPEEIKLYKHAGKPVNATTYKIKESYEPLPFPGNDKAFKAKVVKDIPANLDNGYTDNPFANPFIPKGTITWFLESNKQRLKDNYGTVYPEDNRHITNFPAEYFEVIEEEFTLPEKWYVQPNSEEEALILGRWYDNYIGKREKFYEGCSTTLEFGLGIDHGFGKAVEAITITFDQFRKYVMKSNSDIEKAKVTSPPKFVKFTKENSLSQKGSILKTEEYSYGGWRFVWPDGSGQEYSDEYEGIYTASTEEEYNKYWNTPLKETLNTYTGKFKAGDKVTQEDNILPKPAITEVKEYKCPITFSKRKKSININIK
jgi:hypothetical protein